MKPIYVRVPLLGNFDLVVKLADDALVAMLDLDDRLRDCPIEATTYVHASKREFAAWTIAKDSAMPTASTRPIMPDGEVLPATLSTFQWRLVGDGVLYAVIFLAPSTPPKGGGGARVAELRELLTEAKKGY